MPVSGVLATPAIRVVALCTLLALGCTPAARPAAPAGAPPTGEAGRAAAAPQPAPATPESESLDDLYQKALQEGGTLVFWGNINEENAAKLLPAFERRFPGIEIDYVHLNADRLVARAISEARGSGKVHGDAFQSNLDYVLQLNDQKLLAETTVPEASAYPAALQGSYWVATEQQFLIMAWNTNLVRPEEAPRRWEDLTDARWKNRLIGEPREDLLLVGLKRKYGSEEQAIDVLRKIAANNPEFHRGHSEVPVLIAAGQGAVCFSCHPTGFAALKAKGAPLENGLTEGVGKTSGVAIFKDAPHPNTARLWFRWIISEEGQRATAESGRNPAHPNVQPVEKLRPETAYHITEADIRESPRTERIWKEIFGLR